jgi:hypothetical protein
MPREVRERRRVVIAMATYSPEPLHLRLQIESLRAQTFGDFTCVITDESQHAHARAAIERAIGGDPRFALHSSDRRLGALRNFERALELGRRSGDVVFPCDQDDVWAPTKLERFLGEFTDGVGMVYSDLALIDARGVMVAPSCFAFERRRRRVRYEDLLIRNVVNGCAAAFHANILARALPFPAALESLGVLHDHWCALIATRAAPHRWIDSPLTHYRQHGSNTVGATLAPRLCESLNRAIAAPAGTLRGAARECARRVALDALVRARVEAPPANIGWAALRGVFGSRHAREAALATGAGWLLHPRVSAR